MLALKLGNTKMFSEHFKQRLWPSEMQDHVGDYQHLEKHTASTLKITVLTVMCVKPSV